MPSDSERLIETLCAKRSLFGPGGDPVELLETHISWVLLAGEFAWKIKKPVDFGFLDFSTLERRRRFCEEELRLNGRLAPDLYLDVVEITGSAEDPYLSQSRLPVGPAGSAVARLATDFESTPEVPPGRRDLLPIEYAVLMRRFDQSELLSTALREGRVRSEHVDRLAAEVAEFHGRIAVAPPDSLFGAPDRVLAPVEENFRRLSLTPRDVKSPLAKTVAALDAWVHREHAARTPDFLARRRDGSIRECHGDMHLGNMLLRRDGTVGIFDGIEFNESLRWIDVASEIAFLAMDLEDRGRPDFAHRFLNAYLERTGDYRALAVLAFYQVYRATVRAKVACLRSAQEGLSDNDRTECQHQFRSYIELAERFTRSSPPFLAITSGVSGSGKTCGTQPVVEQLGAIRIRSDVERKRLFGLAACDNSGSGHGTGIYTREASRRTYERLRELTRLCIEAGRSVVLDATFLQRPARDEYRKLADELGAAFAILSFEAPVDVLRERIRQRAATGADASEATLPVLDDQLAHREPFGPDELPHTIAIDTTVAGAAEQAAQTLARRVGSG